MVRWRTTKFLWNCLDNSFLLMTRSYWLSYQFGHKWPNTIRVSFFLLLQTKTSLVSERCPQRFDGQPYLGIWAVTKMFRTSRFQDTPGFPGFVPQGFLRFRFSIWIKAAATLHMALPDYQLFQWIIAINYTALQYHYNAISLHYISLHWFWLYHIAMWPMLFVEQTEKCWLKASKVYQSLES